MKDRHASHRHGFMEFARNDQFPPDAPEPWTAMSGARCCRPITSVTSHPHRHFPSSAHAWRHTSSNCVIHNTFVMPAKWHRHCGHVNRFYLLIYLLITRSMQNPNQSPNSKKRCRWSGTACHRNRSTTLLKASHYDWGDAQKLMMNKSSTQTDYQTSDKLFTMLFQWRSLRCFGANVFQRAKVAKWSR